MSREYELFKDECESEIKIQGEDRELIAASRQWFDQANSKKYSYHFEWLGRPIIQYPQDMVAMQELIWQVRPDLIIETGIAHGGSLILSASILALLDITEAIESGTVYNPREPFRKVLGIDIDIRPHNRSAIEAHALNPYIDMLQGSSISEDIIEQVHRVAADNRVVLVCLDSNHTHDHVLAELEAYAPLTSRGSYCIVFDTIIEDMPADMFGDRPWKPGNSPKTAVHDYLKSHPEFVIDKDIEHKLLVTVAPDGFLKRIG